MLKYNYKLMIVTKIHKLSKSSKMMFSVSQNTQVRAKIDPMNKQVDNFLQNVNVFEEQTTDVEMPYLMHSGKLAGFATAQGTDRYYRRS